MHYKTKFFRRRPVPNRKCGNCQACCMLLEVKDLNKPVKTACQHQCAKGCAIYTTKPDTCNKFKCVWLQGWYGDQHARPDRLGLMVTAFLHAEDEVLHFWEVWPGALANPECKKIIMEIAQQRTIVIVQYSGKMGVAGTRENNQKFLEKHSVLLEQDE